MAALILAIFSIVSTEFVIVGLLPPISRDLGVPVEASGRLVTWFALAAGLGGPVVTMLTSRARRRPSLVAATIVFSLTNALIALAPAYGLIVLARIIQGAVLPAFVSVASVSATQLVPPGRGGQAISMLYAGVALATVLGVPLGTIVAASMGWPAVFLALAVLCALSAGLLAALPPIIEGAPAPSLTAQTRLLAEPMFLVHLALSAIVFAAMFASYT
jgi:predicted MFS family arabinose efflux permease